jgi:phage minor structural protein
LTEFIVKNIVGNSELLTDYSNISRKQRVNGDRSLSFFVVETERNQHAFPLVVEESIVEYDGVEYRIKNVEERTITNVPVKSVTASHVFFDIVDEFQYGVLTDGSKSISQALSHALANTGYTFTVIDAFGSVSFEKFGNDTALALFQTILERYQAEFDIVGTDVKIRSKIGTTPDFQFRFKHNVKTFSKTVNSNNLSTYIKGYGKQNDDGTYVTTATYTSPESTKYKDRNGNVKLRHAKPLYFDTITMQAALLTELQKALIDKPEISFELEFVTLKENGYPSEKPNLGDTIPTIYEPLNVDVDLRILEIEDYPESMKSPKVALSNVKRTFADVQFNRFKNELDKIYDENSGKLRYNVYSEAVKTATEALNNSLTELEYPPGLGIIARDPNNANRFVALRSEGLGVTTDGGATFKEAITSNGVNTSLLTAGQIKTNNVQIVGNDNLFYWDGTKLIAISATDPNKYVQLNSSGLDVKKGMIEVEREDGFLTIIGGKINQDFTIQGATPPFMVNASIAGRHFMTNDTTADGAICQLFTFRRIARYVTFHVEHHSTVAGNTARVIIQESGATGWLANANTTSTEETYSHIVVDLGTPTGTVFGIYLRLQTNSVDTNAFCRVLRAYQHD